MEPISQLRVENERWRRGEITRSMGHAVHFRREMPRLLQTIDRSRILYPMVDSGAHYRETSKTWTFSCGDQLTFGHMEAVEDRFDHQSAE